MSFLQSEKSLTGGKAGMYLHLIMTKYQVSMVNSFRQEWLVPWLMSR